MATGGSAHFPGADRLRKRGQTRPPPSPGDEAERRAAADVSAILHEEWKREKLYAAVVSIGLAISALVDCLFVIFDVTFVLTLEYHFFMGVSIVYLVSRSLVFLFLLAGPYLLYTLAPGPVRNQDDVASLQAYRESLDYRLNRVMFSNPGYLYDRRDARNGRSAVAIGTCLFFATFATLWLYGHLSSLTSELRDKDWPSSVANGDYSDLASAWNVTEETALNKTGRHRVLERALILASCCAAVHLFEAFLVFTEMHCFFRRALPPPKAFFEQMLDGGLASANT